MVFSLGILFLYFLGPSKVTGDPSLGIFAGETVNAFSSYPYMAYLSIYDPETKKVRHSCGGSVLNERHILTAGHCFFPSGVHLASNLSVASLGTKTIEIDLPADRLEVQGYPIMHPEYNRRGLKHDLAVIRLNSPIDFKKYPNIETIEVAAEGDKIMGETCYLLGWGANGTSLFTHTLNVARFQILQTKQCFASSHRFNEKFSICAASIPDGDKAGRGRTCKGDSGGPLICLVEQDKAKTIPKLVGVISFSMGICNADYWQPTFFPKVPFYKDWITKVINQHR